MMKSFLQMIIQEKDASCDWRSFLHCTDTQGRRWELRGHGTTIHEAVDDAMKAFDAPTEDWSIDGYPYPAPPFTCKFCGAPSWIEPSDQTPPPDYCHESDHGCQADYEDCYDEPE
jgi:hypothetical protein